MMKAEQTKNFSSQLSSFSSCTHQVLYPIRMKLLMISGDRSILAGKRGPFVATLEGLSKEFERIDVIVPRSSKGQVPGSKDSFGTSHLAPGTLPPNIFFYPNPKGLWYQTTWAFRTGLSLIRTHHHDVMTVHEFPPFYNGSAAWLLQRWTGIPYALEIHHIVGWPKPANAAEVIWRLWSRMFLPIEALSSTKIRVVNKTVGNKLARWWISKKKISVVPSFYLDHAALASITARQKKYDMVFAGRLAPNKGIGELLKAMALLADQTLLILGDGPDREKYQAEAKNLGVQSRVEFRGWQATSQDLWSAMTEAHVCVMPSKSEGGPRIALEAMALGLPLVATRVGVMPDVLEDHENGLFTSGTPADIAAKVRTLLRDESLRMHIAQNAPKILDQFDGKKLLKDYAQFLKNLAGPHSQFSAPSAQFAGKDARAD